MGKKYSYKGSIGDFLFDLLIWVFLAAGVFIFASYSDLRLFERAAIPIYFANVVLLVLVLLIGGLLQL